MTAPLDTAGLVERLRHADQHSPQRVFGSRIFGEAADAIEAQARALTAKDSELAEARAASDAAASYEFVANWHDRQAKLFREMADDEPRTAEPARKRASEAAIHHAASAAALRNRAVDERRARTVLSREKEASSNG